MHAGVASESACLNASQGVNNCVPSYIYWTTLDMKPDSIQCFSMCRTERHKLYEHWKEELHALWLTDLKQAMSEYESVREEQRRVQADVDLNILKRARLVGMTTAGVASKQDLVATMAPKVCALQHACNHQLSSKTGLARCCLPQTL